MHYRLVPDVVSFLNLSGDELIIAMACLEYLREADLNGRDYSAMAIAAATWNGQLVKRVRKATKRALNH